MKGLVIKSTGSCLIVRMDDGQNQECHVKGNFRIKGIRTTNPVAVGDIVEVENLPDGTNWITAIAPRRNYIIRRSTNLSKEAHILAANLDQVLLLVTVNHPVTSPTFIDRFLATAEAYRVPVILVINKVDLYSNEEIEKAREWEQLYTSLHYQVMTISVNVPADVERVREQLTGKVTLLSGNSGVGKSTILNALFGETKTRTGLISTSHDKGMHTTTFSEMYALPSVHCALSTVNCQQSWLIDTPGVKGFGGVEMNKYEVSHYFRELFQVGQQCRYSDCLHMGEPGCAVIPAVEQGQIALSRYESYISLLGDAEESKYR
ncbi:MAG: ribosome small subunit-dependent GTPase A [Paludibacteraceae bacterium]|nr:ribosome small subunit-dependent GTPase A [Paludibacteraceae bacterium]